MKRYFLYMSFLMVTLSMLFVSCSNSDDPKPPVEVFPQVIYLDIPRFIDKPVDEGMKDDVITGKDVYFHSAQAVTLIRTGAVEVNNLLAYLRANGFLKEKTFQFVQAGEVKKGTVNRNVLREGKNWKYEFLLKDPKGNLAFQYLWNPAEREAISIYAPYYYDKKKFEKSKELVYRIDYAVKKVGNPEMTISLSGYPEIFKSTYELDNLKFHVKRSGDIIELAGNVNYPRFKLTKNETKNRSYALMLKLNKALGIGVAKVAVPPSTLENVDDVYAKYELYNVIKKVVDTFPKEEKDKLASKLNEIKSPAFFVGGKGFVSAGTPPAGVNGFTRSFQDFSKLKPFVPAKVKALDVQFIK
ncbi:hypothetical protein EMN47_18405 [Prolixibacteraceae bacterium JC049]|nr:hypothetical protein [Prolixibacteraceae bacterium JC049]